MTPSSFANLHLSIDQAQIHRLERKNGAEVFVSPRMLKSFKVTFNAHFNVLDLSRVPGVPGETAAAASKCKCDFSSP